MHQRAEVLTGRFCIWRGFNFQHGYCCYPAQLCGTTLYYVRRALRWQQRRDNLSVTSTVPTSSVAPTPSLQPTEASPLPSAPEVRTNFLYAGSGVYGDVKSDEDRDMRIQGWARKSDCPSRYGRDTVQNCNELDELSSRVDIRTLECGQSFTIYKPQHGPTGTGIRR